MSNSITNYGAQFFPDQNVLARDLNTIQYTGNKIFQDFMQLATKLPGVLMGDPAVDGTLQVTTINGVTFDVTNGAAVTSAGHVIQVPITPTEASGSSSQDPLYYPPRPERTSLTTGVAAAGTYYVNLEYRVIQADERFDDAGNAHFTRLYDSYAIVVSTTRSTSGITLAQIITDASGNIVANADSSLDGYNNYALYDERPTWEIYQGQFIAVNATLVTQTAQLAELLEKSIGFQYPQAGNSFYIQIPVDLSLVGLNVYCDGDANAAVQINLDVGSDANNLTSLASTTATGGNPPVWAAATLSPEYSYDSNTLIKISIGSATGTVISCTAQLTYVRR